MGRHLLSQRQGRGRDAVHCFLQSLVDVGGGVLFSVGLMGVVAFGSLFVAQIPDSLLKRNPNHKFEQRDDSFKRARMGRTGLVLKRNQNHKQF